MKRLGTWLVNRASCSLDSDEREALLGDLAESQAGTGRALCDILGLAARRQVIAWGAWRPWFALLLVIVPVGMVLGLVSRFWADETASTINLYVTHWNGPVFRNPGGRDYLIERASFAFLHCAALACWSWTCGAVLVALSRRTSAVNGAFLVVVLLGATLGTTTSARHNPLNTDLFEPITQMLAFLIRAAAVVLPAVLALICDRTPVSLRRAAYWTVAASVLTFLTIRGIEGSLFFGWVQAASDGNMVKASPVLRGQWLPGPDGYVVSADDVLYWPLRWLPLLTLWPVTVLLAIAALSKDRRAVQTARDGMKSPGVLLLGVLVLVSSSRSFAQAGRDYSQWRGQNRDGSASAFVAPTVWPDQLVRAWRVEVGAGYATPLVVESNVYAFVRQGNEEVLLALDAENGRERWRTAYAAPYTPAPPAKVHGAWPKATPLFHNGRLFTLGISGILSAFDPSSGKLLWQTDPPKEAPFYGAASSPVGYQDLVIAHPGNYGALTAYDAARGTIRWTTQGMGFFASPIVTELSGVRQVVTVLLDSIIGVSAASGEILWRYPCAAGGGAVTPLIHNDMVIVAGLQMGVVAIRPQRDDGRWSVDEVWETKDVPVYVSTPVVSRGIVFGLSNRNSGQFFALDASTGKLLWRGPPREAANTAIVKTADTLFFLNDDAELIVLPPSPEGFLPIRRYTVADSATWAQPAFSGRAIFVKDTSTLARWTY